MSNELDKYTTRFFLIKDAIIGLSHKSRVLDEAMIEELTKAIYKSLSDNKEFN